MGIITRITNTFVLFMLMLMTLAFSLAFACVRVNAYQLMPSKMGMYCNWAFYTCTHSSFSVRWGVGVGMEGGQEWKKNGRMVAQI